jgi:hypothetical protein
MDDDTCSARRTLRVAASAPTNEYATVAKVSYFSSILVK